MEISDMEAWQILSEVLERGDQKAIRHALNVGPTLVHGWTIPPKRDGGEGELSPLARAIDLVKAVRSTGNVNAERLIQWLNDQLGYFAVPASVLLSRFKSYREVSDFMKETSEFLGALADADADGHRSTEEVSRIRRQLRDVIEVAMAIDLKLQNETIKVVKLGGVR